MKPLERSLSLIFIGTLVISLLFSCNLLGSSENEGPRLTELPGKIVYSAEQGDETHLFITDQEGTRQLTSAEGMGERDYYASNPSFSPDGQWVVYASNRASAWEESLYRIRTDGSERQSLKDADGEPIVGNNPVFSPDGKKVVFNRAKVYEPEYYNEDIYVVELASGEVRKLTENTAHDTHPTWSPDGQRIAFTSGRDYIDADNMRWRKDLYILNADGTDIQQLTKTGNADIPKWSSSAIYIAYAWQHPDQEVYLLEFEPINIVQLTNLKAVGEPMWSSNGSQLLISGTTNKDERVLQLISTEGKILKEIELNFDASNIDWYDSR